MRSRMRGCGSLVFILFLLFVAALIIWGHGIIEGFYNYIMAKLDAAEAVGEEDSYEVSHRDPETPIPQKGGFRGGDGS